MKKKTRFYAAYGSNLNVEQMHRRCPNASPFGTGTLQNTRLLFKGSKTGAYLTVEQADGFETPVGIWEITSSDERALDRYEGYPGFYDKRRIIFRGENGNTLEALIYVMHEHFKLGIPSKAYINTCLEGYEDFGFDPKYIETAVKYVKKEVKPNDQE